MPCQHPRMSVENTLGILESMPLETTIKVSRDLRDRINAAARDERVTPSSFLEVLVAAYELERLMEAAAAEMAAASDDDWDEPPYPKPAWLRAQHEASPPQPLTPRSDDDPYPRPAWLDEPEGGVSIEDAP